MSDANFFFLFNRYWNMKKKTTKSQKPYHNSGEEMKHSGIGVHTLKNLQTDRRKKRFQIYDFIVTVIRLCWLKSKFEIRLLHSFKLTKYSITSFLYFVCAHLEAISLRYLTLSVLIQRWPRPKRSNGFPTCQSMNVQ